MSPSARGQKRDRERARAERAVMKKERRDLRHAESAAGPAEDEGDTWAEADVLAALADLHRRFADEQVSHEDFESERALLTSRLRIN